MAPKKRAGKPKKRLEGWGNRLEVARTAMKGKRESGEKMTQDELGAAVGLTQQAIAQYETERYEPSIDTWIKLARALGVSPCDLAFGSTHVPLEEEGVERAVEGPRKHRKSEA